MTATVLKIAPTYLAPDNAAVAAGLREIADDIENGEWGDVDTVISVIEESGSVHRQTFGKPIDRARVVGLLTYAAHMALTDD